MTSFLTNSLDAWDKISSSEVDTVSCAHSLVGKTMARQCVSNIKGRSSCQTSDILDTNMKIASSLKLKSWKCPPELPPVINLSFSLFLQILCACFFLFFDFSIVIKEVKLAKKQGMHGYFQMHYTNLR